MVPPLPPIENRDLTPDEVLAVQDRVKELLELRYRAAAHSTRYDLVEDVIHEILTKGINAHSPAYGGARQLLQRWGSWEAVRTAPGEAVASYVKSLGLYTPRARRLQQTLDIIHSRSASLGGNVTSLHWLKTGTQQEACRYLASLPGMTLSAARRLVAEEAAVNTENSDSSTRILSRLGLLRHHETGKTGRTPAAKVDTDDFRENLRQHARAVCHPSRPDCGRCPLISFCKTGRTRYHGTGQPVAVETFAGGGGMGEGFARAGFDVAVAVEIDRDAAQTYRLNHPGTVVIEADATTITGDDITRLVPRASQVTAIMAGPPCQGYSVAGKRQASDKRNSLYTAVVSLAAQLQPRFVIIENVPGIRGVGGTSYVQTVLDALADANYDASESLLRACDFGVPQLRRRMIFTAQRRDLGTAPIPPAQTHCSGAHCRKCRDSDSGDCGLPRVPTMLDVLAGLPHFGPGDGAEYVPSEDGSVPLTNATTMAHSPAVVEKISAIRAGSGPISYRRLHHDIARTIVAGHRALPVHPILHRTISVREAARIQGFRDNHVFAGIRSRQPLQVANAVPPALAQALAENLLSEIVIPVSLAHPKLESSISVNPSQTPDRVDGGQAHGRRSTNFDSGSAMSAGTDALSSSFTPPTFSSDP